jgi:hypothetical protein
MTDEQRTQYIKDIAQAACDSFDLKEHLRSLYWDTLEDLELNRDCDDYLKQEAEFFGLEMPQ